MTTLNETAKKFLSLFKQIESIGMKVDFCMIEPKDALEQIDEIYQQINGLTEFKGFVLIDKETGEPVTDNLDSFILFHDGGIEQFWCEEETEDVSDKYEVRLK